MSRDYVKLVREYGREYSLFRTVLLNQVMNYDLPREFSPMSLVGSYAIYWGKGLVYGYHGESDMGTIFKRITEVANEDLSAVEKRLDETEELFNWLKPYYTLRKKIVSLSELKEFYDRYHRYFFLQSFVQAVPRIDIPDSIRERGQRLREKIQEYNEGAEIVFENALSSIYPSITGNWKFLLPEEIWGGKVVAPQTSKAIEQRKQGFVMFKEHFYAGPVIGEYLNKLNVILDDVSDRDIREFKGQTAQKGIVQGPVKIVDSSEAINKVRQGDVLVASMTMPRYLPAMKKAIAFVTDEGGITCHAAIIARELKKPCVIGTKIATRVLRDGDLVEVNADQGIVKILKRS